MINLKEEANTKTTTALTVTTGGSTRFYHVDKANLANSTVHNLAKKCSLTDLSVTATELQEFLNSSGRAYKQQAHELASLLFGLNYDVFHCEIADLKAAKSRRQVDNILEDVVYTLCSAFLVKSLSENNKEPSNAAERITAICEGREAVLTEQQASNLLELAFRKNKKKDTSADWKAVIKHCCKVIAAK